MTEQDAVEQVLKAIKRLDDRLGKQNIHSWATDAQVVFGDAKQALAACQQENERLLRDVLHRVQVAHEYPERGDIGGLDCVGDECEACYGILPLLNSALEEGTQDD